MNQVEAYIQFKPDMIDDDGNVTVPDTEKFLRSYMEEYAAFLQRMLAVLPRDA